MKGKTTFDRVTLILGGLAVMYFVTPRTFYYLSSPGWRTLIGPLTLISGLILFIEGIWPEGGKKKKKAQTTVSAAGRPLPPGTPAEIELALLQVARRHGPVTVELAALETGLSLSDTRTALKRMEERGYAVSEVDEAGCLWYGFAGLRKALPGSGVERPGSPSP